MPAQLFLPPPLFQHILSYCNDPLIMYKRLHAQWWVGVRIHRIPYLMDELWVYVVAYYAFTLDKRVLMDNRYSQMLVTGCTHEDDAEMDDVECDACLRIILREDAVDWQGHGYMYCEDCAIEFE